MVNINFFQKVIKILYLFVLFFSISYIFCKKEETLYFKRKLLHIKFYFEFFISIPSFP